MQTRRAAVPEGDPGGVNDDEPPVAGGPAEVARGAGEPLLPAVRTLPLRHHAALAAGAAVAGLALAGPLGLGAGIVPAVVQRVSVAVARRRRQTRLAEQFPEAVEMLADAVRAKGSLRLAIFELSAEGPEAVRPAFVAIRARLDGGYPLGEAIEALSDLGPVAGAEAVLLATRLHIEAGGNLPASLESIADTCRTRVSVERELRAMTAQGRFSGLVVAVAPLAFALGGAALGLGGRFLFSTPAGAAVLVAGLALDLAGLAWIRRACSIRW